MKRLIQLALTVALSVAVASQAVAGISSPYPWYWGQDGSNPGSLVLSTTAWSHVKTVQIIPQGGDPFTCHFLGNECDTVFVHVAFKHPQQANVHIIATVAGQIVTFQPATTGSDGSVDYIGIVPGSSLNGNQSPLVALYMLAAGSSVTFQQSQWPSQYIQLDATNLR